jgi:hypothetical protein
LNFGLQAANGISAKVIPNEAAISSINTRPNIA